MSLYYEASDILANTEAKGGSLKNRIFGKKDLKSSPGAIFALVAETTKWSSVLKEVIEKSDILKLEKKVPNFVVEVVSSLGQLALAADMDNDFFLKHNYTMVLTLTTANPNSCFALMS